MKDLSNTTAARIGVTSAVSKTSKDVVKSVSIGLKELLDRPIAFHRAFVSLGVGVTGALFLSQAIYWTTRTRDEDGWFYKSMEEWEEETGMTRSEQETARKRLVGIGVLQEVKKGVPCRLFYRVNMSAIYAFLPDGTPQPSLQESRKQARRKPAGKAAENPQPLYTETTTETTTETSARAAGADVSVAKKQPKNLGLRELIALGVDRQHAEDWLQARRAKRLPLTATALDGVKREAEKAGMTLPQAIAKAASEGWAGFKASWIHTSPRGPAPENFESRDYGTGGRL